MAVRLRTLVLGCGNMGSSHALAYHQLDECELVGLVDREPANSEKLRDTLGADCPTFKDVEEALDAVKPDLVGICTYPDTHEEYALMAFERDCHVFLEKPVAVTVEGANRVVAAAVERNRKLVVGYILRHHPSWIRFVEIAKKLGKPLVMRMNLNQQSSGGTWDTHKNLMKAASPIVDCGVHYVDAMCQMTGAVPARVSAMGARLTDDLVADMYNYGQLQVTFDDGSVGWYEAGWGPMMSETAFFVKDVIGPEGSCSIVASQSRSDNINAHTKTESLKVHHSRMDENGAFAEEDDIIDLTDEPDHNALCKLEQEYVVRAIREDLDLTTHMNDAVNSLRIVLAADESVRTKRTVEL